MSFDRYRTLLLFVLVSLGVLGPNLAAQPPQQLARRTVLRPAPAPPKTQAAWRSPAAQHSPKAQQTPVTSPTPAKFTYPDPKSIGVPMRRTHAHAPQPLPLDRYAKISETEVQRRICEDQACGRCQECRQDGELCPLCEDPPKTPCGECDLCRAGFPCEKALCRHCVQPRSMNMGNSCDLSAGGEPCGTCDACRAQRSDPCEHADDGYGPRGEFNPYKEPRLLSTLPRPLVDTYNNGARKFPVYYNPAPYYRPHWNPSTFAAYKRPFSFRWSCPLCHKDPCECSRPGFAGQVPYAYSCKFCNRNPCTCTAEICNVTKPLDPAGVSKALSEIRRESTQPQNAADRATEQESPKMLDEAAPKFLAE